MRVLILLLFIPWHSYAQNKLWTLDQCIDSAIENNVGMQKTRIQSDLSLLELQSTKQSFIPTVNAGASHGYNWGQTIDLFTNEFATNRVQFNNFYLNSSATIFQGMQKYYLMKYQSSGVEQSNIELEIAKRNLKIDISAAYLQLLLIKGQISSIEKQIERNENHLEIAQLLLESEQSTEGRVLEAKAQLAQSRYSKLKLENDQYNALLVLQHLINVPTNESFDINVNSIVEATNLSSINDSIINQLPEVIQLNISESKQLFLIKNTRGKYYPSLQISASVGSGFSGNNQILNTNGVWETKPFNQQINDNLYQSARLTLSIPIFNSFSTRNQVKKQQLELQSIQLDQIDLKNQLIQKLELITNEINNLNAQRTAMSELVHSRQMNYSNFLELYENGQASLAELKDAQSELFQTENEASELNYQLLFKKLVLSYYLN